MKPLLIAIVAFSMFSRIGSAQDNDADKAADQVRRAEDTARKAEDQARVQEERVRQHADAAAARQPFPAPTSPPAVPAIPGTSFSDRLQNIIRRTTVGSAAEPAKPVIIRSSNMDPKDQSSLEEDLAIMARVLDKALEEAPGAPGSYHAMGIDIFSPNGAPMRDLYLDGYGALFVVNVGFPLLPPPPAPAEQTKEEAQSDSAWEQAKQDLYGQNDGMPRPPLEQFSEEKVAQLKNRLLEAFKSASNIRQLKSDDSVTVCVMGGATEGRPRSAMRMGARAGAGQSTSATGDFRARYGIQSAATIGTHATIMTIRAKKSAIDSFAKGKIDADQFRKDARIEVYVGSGSSSGGGMAGFGASGGGLGGGGSGRF